jgi:hypothetical protein
LPSVLRTGSWSKPFSRMSSIAAWQGSFARTVVTGLSRSDPTLPVEKRFLESGAGGADGVVLSSGVVEASRSFAASQSSSAN